MTHTDDINDPQDRGRRTPRRAVPRWLPLPLGIGIGLLGGIGYGLVATPQYAATSYVMVVPRQGTDSPTALGFAQAYGRIVTGSAVLAGAQAATHTAAGDLKSHVQAATSPDAPMISVTGSSSKAGTAASIANGVARSLAATGNRDSDSTGVRLLLFSPAAAPAAPSSPSAALSGAVGASAGGLLGALVLLVRPRREEDAAHPARTPLPSPSAAPSAAPSASASPSSSEPRPERAAV
ncbi:lipopolysaccharide biosynthesis protein [Streptomyces sp. NBC_00669]|uniref:lipopolysaccharide biosynthesis protein n=1 Tax=Streptomyces sp. NBC_00669 TaxID=2976011 RepID=UPI002E379877|nr:lipopolysaccharide biosynthesis protein [Streptomyces sp. NBC_00669]